MLATATRSHGNVSIGPPDEAQLREAARGSEIESEFAEWWQNSAELDDGLYFQLSEDGRAVGQILLHDRIDDVALAGYHIFSPRDRGRGIGRIGLSLLVDYVTSEMDITTLVAITSDENMASRRIAELNGFAFARRPDEDPADGRVYRRDLGSR